MPEGPTISNSSCLIALHAAGYLDLLQQLYTAIEVPEAVAEESFQDPFRLRKDEEEVRRLFPGFGSASRFSSSARLRVFCPRRADQRPELVGLA
jgi:hypothetical protein